MKKNKHLNKEQRYQIEAYIKVGLTDKEIATKMGKHRSTIYRERTRNSKRTKNGNVYIASFAHHLATKRKERKRKHVSLTDKVKRRIRWLIKHYWSPEQIADVCKKRLLKMVSPETIYQYLYRLKRAGTDLCKYLRRGHRRRRKRANKYKNRSLIKDKTSIEQRPEVVDKQERIGDFEIDTMKAKNGYLLTITDRKSLFNIIAKTASKKAADIQSAFSKAVKPYVKRMKTITSDNGLEFAKHKKMADEVNVDWYFAHTYSSFERGCNENQNGLIRQFIKRSTDLNKVSEQRIQQIQKMLNNRPRKKIEYCKPIHVFLENESLHL